MRTRVVENRGCELRQCRFSRVFSLLALCDHRARTAGGRLKNRLERRLHPPLQPNHEESGAVVIARKRPIEISDKGSIEISGKVGPYHWTLDEMDTLHELAGINRLWPVDFPENASEQQVIDALHSRKRFGDIPDDAIEKIVDVMCVPESHRRLAGELLDVTVTATLKVHDYLGMDFYGKTTRAQLDSVVKDAEQLARSLRQLDRVASKSINEALLEFHRAPSRAHQQPLAQRRSEKHARYRPGALFGPSFVIDTLATDSIRFYHQLLLRLAIAAKIHSMPKPKSVSHRPRGSIKHPAFHFLLRDLRRSMKPVGGRLTCRMENGRLKGTIPVVLEMLRPYLRDVIPPKLSYSSIRRALLQKAPQT
jgi:hypothetical protein